MYGNGPAYLAEAEAILAEEGDGPDRGGVYRAAGLPYEEARCRLRSGDRERASELIDRYHPRTARWRRVRRRGRSAMTGSAQGGTRPAARTRRVLADPRRGRPAPGATGTQGARAAVRDVLGRERRPGEVFAVVPRSEWRLALDSVEWARGGSPSRFRSQSESGVEVARDRPGAVGRVRDHRVGDAARGSWTLRNETPASQPSSITTSLDACSQKPRP